MSVYVMTVRRGAAGKVWLYTFAADDSWAQSAKYDGTVYDINRPRTRIHGAARLERRLMCKQVKRYMRAIVTCCQSNEAPS